MHAMLDPPKLLREARARAGFSQRELARRAGTSQSVIARIERGQTSPSHRTLDRLLAAAGFHVRAELALRPVAETHMLDDVARILALSPEERLLEVRKPEPLRDRRAPYLIWVTNLSPLDPERLVKTLAQHRVRYVLVGALAARLQGFPRVTADADITPARDAGNRARLAAALRDLGARIYTESAPAGLTFDFTGDTLNRAEIWNLTTSACFLALEGVRNRFSTRALVGTESRGAKKRTALRATVVVEARPARNACEV